MKKDTIMKRFQYSLGAFFFRCIAKIPLPLLHAIAVVFSLVRFYSQNKTQKNIAANIHFCFPELSKEKRKNLIRRAIVSDFQTKIEAPWLLLRESKKIFHATRWQDFSLVENAFKNKQQMLLLGCHMGSFPVMTCQSAIPLVWLSKKQKGLFEHFFSYAKNNTRNGTFFPPTYKGMRDIAKALYHGENICLLCDHDPGSRAARIKCNFFGKDSYTTTLPHNVIMRAPHIRVFFWVIIRVPLGRGFIASFFEADDAVYSKNVVTSTTAINAQLERIIRLTPEQYYWSQERFRRTHKHIY